MIIVLIIQSSSVVQQCSIHCGRCQQLPINNVNTSYIATFLCSVNTLLTTICMSPAPPSASNKWLHYKQNLLLKTPQLVFSNLCIFSPFLFTIPSQYYGHSDDNCQNTKSNRKTNNPRNFGFYKSNQSICVIYVYAVMCM